MKTPSTRIPCFLAFLTSNAVSFTPTIPLYDDSPLKLRVLSFPIFEKEEIDEKIKNHDFEHEDVLGDIIISIKQVEAQAKEYGHSFEREFAYMLVHGFYHLMGYDHIQEEDKVVMRAKEEKVLEKLEIRRDEMNEG